MGSFTGHGRCAGHTTGSTDDAFFLSHGWTRVPAVVQLMVTTRCPMSCPHCLADDGGPGRDAPAEVIEAVLDAAAEQEVEELLLTGGEPLARGDFAALVDDLGGRGISWSLNTAWSPDAEQRRAIEKNPPGFVAVSLDGPAALHDEFRGLDGAHELALDAIGWFSSLEGCTVTAGTTVTRRNVRHLERCLHEVAASGAEAWGLHLLVPEGRAAGRDDLTLRRSDIEKILRFTARRRSVFPVSMADEMGYCGEWEPLVRDLPLGCGAGRAMCVVLPDGEVVPCTTMDRSVSAGNVLHRPLTEIWTEGFGDLRTWTPDGCGACGYASACRGGCWLHRRRGARCYKDVWQMPGALKTAASVAVCLGALAASPASADEPKDIIRHDDRTTPVQTSGATLESLILRWYGDQLPTRGRGTRVLTPDPDPPAVSSVPPGPLDFLSKVRGGTLPADIEERLTMVKKMAAADHGSLAFDALLLRVATEAAFAAPPLAERPAAMAAALGETLRAIRDEAAALRVRVFDEKLDPYLRRGRLHLRHRFEMSKAYRPPPGWLKLERDTAEERWGFRADDTPDITRDYLARHPWGGHLAVALRTRRGFPAASGPRGVDWRPFGPFDSLQVPRAGRQAPGSDGAVVELRLRDTEWTVMVTLPPGTTITWPDLLRTAWDQHRDAIAGRVDALGSVDLDTSKDPLLLPGVTERLGRRGHDRAAGDLQLWLTDFWLF